MWIGNMKISKCAILVTWKLASMQLQGLKFIYSFEQI